MASHATKHEGTPVRDEQDRELDVPGILKFGVATAIILLGGMAGMVGLMKAFNAMEIAADPAPSPLAEAREPHLPPEPRLQASPPLDVIHMLESEDKVLKGYAWVDKAHGVAAIPVSRAIDIVAARGLAIATPKSAEGSSAPGTATSEGSSMPGGNGAAPSSGGASANGALDGGVRKGDGGASKGAR